MTKELNKDDQELIKAWLDAGNEVTQCRPFAKTDPDKIELKHKNKSVKEK
jgi:hypothetical protein